MAKYRTTGMLQREPGEYIQPGTVIELSVEEAAAMPAGFLEEIAPAKAPRGAESYAEMQARVERERLQREEQEAKRKADEEAAAKAKADADAKAKAEADAKAKAAK